MPYNPVKHHQTPKPHMGHKVAGRLITLQNGELRRPEGDMIDLHTFLTQNSLTAFLMQMAGNAMRASGLLHGSYLVVERARPMRAGQIVVVRFNGQLVVRRLICESGVWSFCADDPRVPRLAVTEADEVERMGVVNFAITPMAP